MNLSYRLTEDARDFLGSGAFCPLYSGAVELLVNSVFRVVNGVIEGDFSDGCLVYQRQLSIL